MGGGDEPPRGGEPGGYDGGGTWGDSVLAWSSAARKRDLVPGGHYRKHVMVCQHKGEGGCLNRGGFEVKKQFNALVNENAHDDLKVSSVGTMGYCDWGPMAVVYPDNVWYEGLTTEDVPRIFEEHILGGEPVDDLAFDPDLPDDFRHVFVCTFIANCAQVDGGKVYRWFKQRESDDRSLKVTVSMGCLKECSMGPVVCVYPAGEWYTGMTERKAERAYEAWQEGRVPPSLTGRTTGD